MKGERREILLGYLLGALEPHELEIVKAELDADEELQQDLADLYQEISPINEIVEYHEPPAGLAARTTRGIWAKIDAKEESTSIQSAIERAFEPDSHKPRKKRRATATFVPEISLQATETADSTPVQPLGSVPCFAESLQMPHFAVEGTQEGAVAVPPEESPIPLSLALRHTPGVSPKKAKLASLRRIDNASSPQPKVALTFTDSERAIPRKQQPKYYGRKKEKTPKQPKPWSTRDVFASLLVGLTAAVLIFPIIQFGMGNVRNMVVQKKIQNFADSMPANTSQYSPYGLSSSDLQWLVSANIDPQSATFATNRASVSPSLAWPKNQSHESLLLNLPTPFPISSVMQTPFIGRTAFGETRSVHLAVQDNQIRVSSLPQADNHVRLDRNFQRISTGNQKPDLLQSVLVHELFQPIRSGVASNIAEYRLDYGANFDSQNRSVEMSVFP